MPRALMSSYFNPRSPHGERPSSSGNSSAAAVFQPTLPARGATRLHGCSPALPSYFNPRSPHGERLREVKKFCTDSDFNPRSPHGERRGQHRKSGKASKISTHAPRTGSDGNIIAGLLAGILFQPTLPARGATRMRACRSSSWTFQPTLPARGATYVLTSDFANIEHFNPRSPHGERRDGSGHFGVTS